MESRQTGLLELEVYDLGTVEYAKTLELQRAYHRKVIEGSQGDVLLACSHFPVITCGTSTPHEHLLFSPDKLAEMGLPVHVTERGGGATYHGPETAVIYPIINLHRHRTDVGWYMRSLEEVAIRTVAEFGITSIRIPGKTGVWIDEHSKIAFSGVRISRWCTLHGISLNVLPCSTPFSRINPCGLGDIRIISIAELSQQNPSVVEVTGKLIKHFTDIFGYTPLP
jgi:lipoate-protein ligase B